VLVTGWASVSVQVWDPALIIAQIISVQCLFYVSLGLIQALTIGERPQ
jgi:hypothetical protein